MIIVINCNIFDENLGKHNKYSHFRDSPENWKSIMSRGTIDIYEYLHEKVLSEKNPQSNMASKTLSNQLAFGVLFTNGNVRIWGEFFVNGTRKSKDMYFPMTLRETLTCIKKICLIIPLS